MGHEKKAIVQHLLLLLMISAILIVQFSMKKSKSMKNECKPCLRYFLLFRKSSVQKSRNPEIEIACV